MHGIKYSVALLGLGMAMSLAPVHAVALTKTLAWNASTLNTDGTPATIIGYKLYRSSDNGATFLKEFPMTGATILTFTDTAVPVGQICYEVTALNANGESARSNRVCFLVSESVPNAPTNLRENVPVAAPRRPGGK